MEIDRLTPDNNCLDFLSLSKYLNKNKENIKAGNNAIARVITSRCYYSCYNYLIKFAIDENLHFREMIGESSHIDKINDITNSIDERYPSQHKRIIKIKSMATTLKQRRANADYYFSSRTLNDYNDTSQLDILLAEQIIDHINQIADISS